MTKELADELTRIAVRQLEAGKKIKGKRIETVRKIEDLYYGKIIKTGDNRINIPFPIMSGFIDEIFSKIDNPPSVFFKIPNRTAISKKIEASWKMDTSSMRASWGRKDREEKLMALLSGRGISSIFASSVNNKYKSHYNIVDHLNFVCEGTTGHLDDMLYCGEEGIWKTEFELKDGVKNGFYDSSQVSKLLSRAGGGEHKTEEEQQDKVDRLSAIGISPDNNSYVGQKVYSLVQWNMLYNGVKYGLLFDTKAKLWIDAYELKNKFSCNKYIYISWASGVSNPSVFWTQGPGDIIMPIAEAMRLLLNEILENARRRNRPMRIVKSGDFPNVTELMDYLPDNIIQISQNKTGNIATIETPEISVSLDYVNYLNNFLKDKVGISGTGVDEKDIKVGVYYGNLQKEADRIGIINKNYSESYAEKAYRYFWGLKDNLTESKSIEMLGKRGIKWEELEKTELNDVDDVDDVIVSGGSREEQINSVIQKTQIETLSQLAGNPMTAGQLSPRWLTKTMLKNAGWEDEDIQEALDLESDPNRDLMNEADQAIQEILLGKNVKLNMGANIGYMQRILDFVVDNLNYVKLDNKGNEIGIDKKIKKSRDDLLAYMYKHQPIVIENMQRDLRKQQAIMAQPVINPNKMNIPQPTQQEQQMAIARPNENPSGTMAGTAETSANLTQKLI